MHVEEGWGRKGAREEVYCRGWGTRMQALDSLESLAAVKGEDINFTRREAE